ncbi:MAG: molybdopterin dinucleotide binding domain-containing protein, partial [Devosia sp.]|nr:molybdopterin dinucleotide binding domain-containing protein [Devosia sp.]
GMGSGPDIVNRTFPIACLSDAWMNPGKTIEYKGKTITYPDIRLVYISGGNQFTHHQDTNRLIKAFRTPETIVVHEPWWTPTARFADIVLPAASDLERDDLGQVLNMILASHAAVAPQFKSRVDYDIFTEIADRLGYKEKFTEGRDVLGWVRFFYEAARAQSKTVPMPDFDTFWNGEGIIEFPMGKGDFVDLAAYRADPLMNPLGTATGKIEIVSGTVGKLNYPECPGHPTWLEPVEWHGSAAAATYPLQLMSAHAMYRLHSQMDNTMARQWYKVDDREPVLMNPADAEARGIKSGDVVRLFNGRGQTLAGAVVTTDIMAGAVCLHEGSWYDPVTPGALGALDKQGSANNLTRDDPLSSRFGQATIAETAIVQAEKYTGAVPAVTAYGQPA